MSEFTRADVCVIACAETFRGDGEVVANPIGTIPILGGRLARATFESDLVLTDGEALFVANDLPVGVPDAPKVVEGWNPYRMMLEVTWSGRRHVMMGATQIDRFGNQNIACIGSLDAPKVFVEHVDVVTGIGYDRAAELGSEAARFHRIPRVVSNLGTFDFDTSSHTMRLRSVHPGVTVDEVVAATGFELVVADDVPESRVPTAEELALLRDVLDPNDLRTKEVPG